MKQFYNSLLWSIWSVPIAGALLSAVVIYVGASQPTEQMYERGDLWDYYLPQADRIGHAVAGGRWPCWDPNVGCGLDQTGSAQSGLFYPFTYIHALLPVRVSLSCLVIVHLFIAIFGFFLWMRSIALTPLAAWLGASTFAFGLMAEASWPPMLYTLTWGPWILWAISCQGAAHRILACIAVPVALQLSAGFPQFAVYTLLFAGAYAVAQSVGRQSWRPLGMLVAGALLGAGMAAPQLASSVLYLQQCYRNVGPLSPAAVHYLEHSGTSKIQSSPRTVARHLFRGALRLVDNGWPPRPRSLSYRRDYGYLGVVVPLCVGLGLLAWRRWETWFLLVMGIGAIYLSLGYLAGPVPLYGWLAKAVPMFGAFRTPDRLNLWTLIAASAMTAIGANELNELISKGRPVGAKVMLVLAGMVGLRWWAAVTRSGQDWADVAIWVALVLLLGSGVLLFCGRATRLPAAYRRPESGMIVICVVAVVDFVMSARYVARWQEYPGNFYTCIYGARDNEEVLVSRRELSILHRSLGPDRLYIAAPYLPIMMTTDLFNVRTLPFYEPMTPTRHFVLNETITADKVADRQLFYHTLFNYYDLPVSPHLKMFDWCSVRLIVSVERLSDPEQDGWKLVRQLDSGTWLYENEHAVPRAALVGAYRMGSADDAKQEMAATGFADRQQGPWLEDEPSSAWRNSPSAVKEPSGSLGEVTWLVDGPNHLALKVRCDRPAILVLSDSWFPGWRCEVDGQPTEILRANFIHRAVPLSAGEHEVVMDYSPVGMKAGLTVAAIVLSLGIGAVTLQEFRLNRKRLSSNSIDPSWSQR